MAPEADKTMWVKVVLLPASFRNQVSGLRHSCVSSRSSRTLSYALTPSIPARAPLPIEVPDPIVTIETSKMILAQEDVSK